MRKHKYLNRVALTILFLVFIPILTLSLVIWHRASRELKKSSQVYYNQVVSSFASDFEKRIASLQEHALTIALDSKTSKSIFHHRSTDPSTQYYWYYRAIREMQDLYPHYNADYCGIYYYDVDRAVTPSACLSRQFILSGLGIKDTDHRAWDFFDISNYASGQWIFGSTFTSADKDAYILAGYCTELGKEKDPVMIYYALSRSDYARTQSVVYGHSGINFYILDAAGDHTYMLLGDGEGSDSDAYTYQTGLLPLTYEIRASDNTLEIGSDTLYRDIWLTLIVLVLVLALTSTVSIAIMYRPVSSITAELETPGDEADEFGNIRNALGQKRAKIEEQENIIMDLLVKHLIHGVPISPKMIHRLGIAPGIRHYCVFVLSGYMLPASDVESLTQRLENRFSARLFATEWQSADKCVLILFLKEPNLQPLEALLDNWLQYHCNERYCLTRGTVVDNLDDIRASFLSCLDQISAQTKQNRPIREEIKSLDAKDKHQQELKEQILDYLEKHYRDDDIGQVKVADEFRISTYTLSRLFKNQVGVGFTEYVNSKRLEYAKNLLLTTSWTIKDISLKSGYASETYFGRMFKATYGVSPSAFREQ